MLKIFFLLLPCFVSFFWAIFLFINKRNNTRSQNVWSVGMFLITITLYVSIYYLTGKMNYSVYYKMDILEKFSTLSFLPVIFLYFKALTNESAFTWKDYLLFIPGFLIGGSVGFLYLQMGEVEASAYIRDVVLNNGDMQKYTAPIHKVHYALNTYVYSAWALIQVIGVMIYATVQLIVYRNRLDDFFSSLEGKSMDSNWAALKGLFVLLTLTFVTVGMGCLMYIEYSISVSILLMVWGIVLYYVCYQVYKTNYTAAHFAYDLKLADSEALQKGYGRIEEIKELEEADAFNKIRERILPELEKLMNEDKVFLQSDLRLDEVARLLNTNRTYISRLIREEYGCSFSEYINRERIQHAQYLVRSNSQLSQEQIAEMSGFIYTSTFSRIFKRYAGMTFRDFLKKISELV